MAFQNVVGSPVRPPLLRRFSWRLPSQNMQLALLLLAAAFLIRLPQFGNSLFGEDEQFYLLVGERMLHGSVPYVDIWDRKPFGLFALFASFWLINSDGFLVAQTAATLSAASTAFVIALIACRFTNVAAAAGAGIFYLLLLSVLGGDAAQTPVFYNLLIVTAAWLILPTNHALDGRQDMKRAMAAMLLCGIAIQIKTNAVFEGVCFGCWLMVRMWGRVPVALLLQRATAFAVIGLAPTLMVAAGYAWIGHFDSWWFANMVSQLQKEGGLSPDALQRLLGLAPSLVMLAVVGILGTLRLKPSGTRTFLVAWAMCAFADTFVLGNFWRHYTLPFTIPAAILSAPLFAMPRVGLAVFLSLSAWPLVDSQIFDRIDEAQGRDVLNTTLAAIPSDAPTQCLLGYEVPAAYYVLTHACLVTPYLFIDQLRSSAEAPALPVPAHLALRQALQRRPGTILTVANSHWAMRNHTNDALLAKTLRQEYRLIAHLPFRRTAQYQQILLVWRRTDLPVKQL
ncbi:hypothetical protein [Sphingomonas sp. S2-65]|uniref:hypothetical protein n=1 Tax=Sphingomonas sp. S2-65 TaxID=2903960 RepID=UPI001F379E82|nr:hypothetical protein [Sphingomonas sp. S2-65]UYY60160.1 hypothetical protein LZ586_08810 [Sphingomonas sp. S2-65]